MRSENLGGLTTHITGGTDGYGGGDGPVVVLLHGFGAPGTDLVGLSRAVAAPAGTRWIFPEAPMSLTMGFGDSRAWWLIDIDRIERAIATGGFETIINEVPDGLDEARAKVFAMLDALRVRAGISTRKLVLGGFSQGAMLALDVALRSEAPLAGLALLSGTLIAADEWRERMPWRRGLKVFQSHGQLDPILPYTVAEQLKSALTEAGIDLTWAPFRGEHAIPPEVCAKLGAFLRSTLGA